MSRSASPRYCCGCRERDAHSCDRKAKVLPVRVPRMPPQTYSVPYPQGCCSTLSVRTVVAVVDAAVVLLMLLLLLSQHLSDKNVREKAGTGSTCFPCFVVGASSFFYAPYFLLAPIEL